METNIRREGILCKYYRSRSDLTAVCRVPLTDSERDADVGLEHQSRNLFHFYVEFTKVVLTYLLIKLDTQV